MKEQLIQWANAGDGDSMYKLSKIYLAEKDFDTATYWLEKSAGTKNFFAMKELANFYRENINLENDNFQKALELYKEIVEISGDTESMENIVDMCEEFGVDKNNSELLNFILEKIDSMYNEIYIQDYQILRRMWELGTRRHNEFTIQTLQAVERRRIASRIRKILAAN